VAGLFYPDDRSELESLLRGLLVPAPGSDLEPQEPRLPKALVVPHAGYVYSGAVAASAYRRLVPFAADIRHVVLVGPSHRVPMRGLAVPSADWFETPLGRIAIDADARQRLRALGLAGATDAPHAAEHSLEVQLPFLQLILPEFDLLPIAVGEALPQQVARTLNALWGGPETLIVISTDLSHYHTYGEARQLDEATSRALLALRSDLALEQACGAAAVNGLMEVARQRHLEIELLDLRNSGDTAGDRSRVVGYGAYALYT